MSMIAICFVNVPKRMLLREMDAKLLGRGRRALGQGGMRAGVGIPLEPGL